MSNRAENIRVMYPLFQAEEGGSTPTSALTAKQLVIERIPFERAKELNRAWHSRLPRLGTGCIEDMNKTFLCYGAIYKSICFAVGIWRAPSARKLPQDTWLELKRLATAPDKPRNTCSRMLRIMEALIRKSRPEIVKLISYQDTAVHKGGIYAAAGWKKTILNSGGQWHGRPPVQSDAPKQRWEKRL